MTTIHTILTQHGLCGFDGMSKTDTIFALNLGESEMKHNADKYPRDVAYYRKQAARYGDAANAIRELQTAA